MSNKKIKNATGKVYNGIKFRSLLEVMTYKVLLQEGFNPEYEKYTYVVWEGFVPTIPFYTKNKFKRKNHNIKILSRFTVRDNRYLPSITYKPDFYFEYGAKKIIIECKGMCNDVFPYKFKMFREHLQKQPDAQSYEIWEIFTKTQLLECINHLRQSQTK